MYVDSLAFNLIHGFAGRNWLLDVLGVFFATYAGWVLILAGVIFIWRRSNQWKIRFFDFASIILVAILSRGILTELIRFLYHRSRPFMALGFSPLIEPVNQGAFPSGHAAFYFTLALAIFFIHRKVGWYFLASAALIGLARVYVGVHWPMDILGGFLVALVSVVIVRRILNAGDTSVPRPSAS